MQGTTGDIGSHTRGDHPRQAEGGAPDDATLLQRARVSRQGLKFAALYDRGDWKSLAYPSASEGAAALLAMLAFWTDKDEARMDRLFRASGLFDADRWDRRRNGTTLGAIEIRRACEFCRDTYGSCRPCIDFPDLSPRGSVRATIPNLQAVLAHHNITLQYDEIKKEIAYRFDGGSPFSMDNQSNASLGQLMSLLESVGMPTLHLRQYICAIADLDRRNPVRDWILTRPWDGVDRLQPLFDTIQAQAGFPDDMKELLLGKWLLSAVAAACHDPRTEPFMARGVLTLVGPQYIGKTRWLESLAPVPWVKGGHNLDPANKDSVRTAISHWIVELGELESSFKKDTGKLKAFLTLEFDQFRVAYAENDSKFPRRTVFAASVNRPDFLLDETGNSRFWTIPVADVQHTHGIDMQQVYAQLHGAYLQGAEWWLTTQENARLGSINERHEELDEVYDYLTARIDWRHFEEDCRADDVEWLTCTDVLRRCDPSLHPSKRQVNSCARHLRKLAMGEAQRNGRTGMRFPIPRRWVDQPAIGRSTANDRHD